MVHPCKERESNNVKDWTTDTCDHMDDYQTNYAERSQT